MPSLLFLTFLDPAKMFSIGRFPTRGRRILGVLEGRESLRVPRHMRMLSVNHQEEDKDLHVSHRKDHE